LIQEFERSRWIVGYKNQNARECDIRGVAVEADISDLIVVRLVRREIGRIKAGTVPRPGTDDEVFVLSYLISEVSSVWWKTNFSPSLPDQNLLATSAVSRRVEGNRDAVGRGPGVG
jgi:hypothetical protein